MGCFTQFPFSRCWLSERFTAISMSTELRNTGLQALSTASIRSARFARGTFSTRIESAAATASNARTHCGYWNECYLPNTPNRGALLAISHPWLGVRFRTVVSPRDGQRLAACTRCKEPPERSSHSWYRNRRLSPSSKNGSAGSVTTPNRQIFIIYNMYEA